MQNIEICRCEMTLNCLGKLRKLEINRKYKMTLINLSSALKNGKCYSI